MNEVRGGLRQCEQLVERLLALFGPVYSLLSIYFGPHCQGVYLANRQVRRRFLGVPRLHTATRHSFNFPNLFSTKQRA